MLTKKQKAEVVEELQDRFSRQKVSIFATVRGVSVDKLQAFRRELRKIGAELKIAKKSLMRRATDAKSLPVNPEELEGEVGVIFGFEDQVAPAKAAQKFGKENETFKVLAGILDGKALEGKEVLALAKLPTREQLLGQVASVFAAPVRNLASVLQANIRNLAVVLNQVASKKS
jgi:large subunit ribosomal protein L10